VLTAEDGKQALDLIDRKPVDLVLLDVMMPELNGHDVCSEIKARQFEEFLPVILLTALGQQEDRNAGLACGADEFLTKPVNSRELLLRVEALLRIREQDRTIREQYAKLQRLESLKDDLVSMIVHDLRNPLTAVLGYLQMLSAKTENPSHAALNPQVKKALNSSVRCRDILEGLLQVRLLEEGRLPIEPVDVDLGQLVEGAVSAVEGLAISESVRFQLRLQDCPTISLDPNLVRRAVENLLSNAIRYSPTDSTVTVSVGRTLEGTTIQVADHGPGIPDELKHELFQKFGSVEARMASKRRGVGLGLYMVKLVMQAHGGRATVADEKDGGSVFSLVFP
jgi:signal transduction histidine kinase